MKSNGYWQNFSSRHKVFLSILTLTLIAGLFSDDFLGILFLSILVIIIYVIVKGSKSPAEEEKISELSQEKPLEEVRKTKLLFDTPVTSDWLFWVFTVILAINFLGGVSNVVDSGGLSLSTGGIISGLLDALFLVFLSWFPFIPIIYFIRKIVRKRK